MGDVINFQRARGEKFLARMRELEAAGHVPAAAMEIAMHEFGIPDAQPSEQEAEGAFLRMWRQEEQAMNDTLRGLFEMERDAIREVLADLDVKTDVPRSGCAIAYMGEHGLLPDLENDDGD